MRPFLRMPANYMGYFVICAEHNMNYVLWTSKGAALQVI